MIPRLVILESPYGSDNAVQVEINERYARACLRDSLMRGEAPIASHLLYTQPGVLNDRDPAERKRGIAAGLAWGKVAEATVMYLDFGKSNGMTQGEQRALDEGRPIIGRILGGEWAQ